MMSFTSQMRQVEGGEVRGTSNWVPQVGQIARSPEERFMVGGWRWFGLLLWY
jgi:hypothetical protein